MLEDMIPHQWKPGQSGNPKGRPKGSRNQLTEEFLKALAKDFNKHGMAALEAMRQETPGEYIRVVASLMPRELNVKIDPIEDLTDDELIERLYALRSAYAAIVGRPGADGSGSGTALENQEIIALPSLS